MRFAWLGGLFMLLLVVGVLAFITFVGPHVHRYLVVTVVVIFVGLLVLGGVWSIWESFNRRRKPTREEIEAMRKRFDEAESNSEDRKPK